MERVIASASEIGNALNNLAANTATLLNELTSNADSITERTRRLFSAVRWTSGMLEMECFS